MEFSPHSASRPCRTSGILLSLLLAGLVSGSSVLLAEPLPDETDASEDSTASVEEEPAEAPTEPYVIEDEVFVAGRAPAIPSSNTVAAKLPLALQETPASVGIVDSELNQEQGNFLLGDALRNVAGVNVHPGNGTFDFFVVRGLDSLTSGLILTDGAPEPETTSYQLYNVERVEVLKGPSAFLYGGGPLGGTVNLVRKQPLPGRFTEFGLSFGSFDTAEALLDLNYSTPGDRFGFRLASVWQESDLYRDDQSSRTLAVNPSFTWRPGDRTSINLNLEVVDIEYTNDQGLPILLGGSIPEVPRTRSYQSPFDTSDQEILRIQLDYETRISDRFTLRNKTYYRELDWVSVATTFNGVFPNPFTGQRLVSRNLLGLDDLQEFTGNQLEGLWRFETGGVTHNLLVGLEVARYRDNLDFSFGFLPLIDLDNPVETAQQAVLFPQFGADATSEIVAPYVVDQIVFSDTFQLLLGARYDRIDFSDDVTGIEREDDEVSPMLGVVVTPSDTLSFYGSYGEAFAPQSTFVVGQGQNRAPENSRQVEAGVKRELLGGDGRLSLSVYRIDRENIAVPDNATGVLAQTGDQRSEGFELELAVEPRQDLEIYFGYAYTDSEFTELRELVQVGLGQFLIFDRTGNRAPYTPEHLANFWISKSFGGAWTVAGGGRYVGEQFIDEDNVVELEDYVVFDAAVHYDRGPWRLSLNLRNLTDEEYFTRASQGNSVIPVAGFNAFSSLRFRF